MARQGRARRGAAWRGMARPGKAGPGRAGQGMGCTAGDPGAEKGAEMLTAGGVTSVELWPEGQLAFKGHHSSTEVVVIPTALVWEQLARIVRDRDFAAEAEARQGTTDE